MALNDEDKKRFRQALGSFVTGVTIVTTCDGEGNPVGLTANSFNSVSLDPPMVLFSLALDSRALPAFRDASHWAVHILAKSQQDISNLFASRGADKFAELRYRKGPGKIPLLDDYAARFVCKANFEYEGGDHAIFVGEVIEHDQCDEEPLIFHGGRYGEVMPSLPPPVPQEIEDAGEFSRHFIGHILGLAYSVAMGDVREYYHQAGLKAAEYTVLASLGLGEGCSRAALVERARRGGVEVPGDAIQLLIDKGLLEADGEGLLLTRRGRKRLVELVAVAQSSQLRMEHRLTQSELGLLYNLLQRISADR